ncbi:MAG: hypothetical protein AYP45_06030 [Candidatus Brocadia carolinensis]|uniref:Uncharacterized protein n=1 Tax=Candidatus Brocadia carolinensis TaxID=1004156 RepID=A0A1V4AV22_9BACT|nr:MAG: hypothetical protein AYP45_06030 [Candidatus Brocadia caroliniensis]
MLLLDNFLYVKKMGKVEKHRYKSLKNITWLKNVNIKILFKSEVEFGTTYHKSIIFNLYCA